MSSPPASINFNDSSFDWMNLAACLNASPSLTPSQNDLFSSMLADSCKKSDKELEADFSRKLKEHRQMAKEFKQHHAVIAPEMLSIFHESKSESDAFCEVMNIVDNTNMQRIKMLEAMEREQLEIGNFSRSQQAKINLQLEATKRALAKPLVDLSCEFLQNEISLTLKTAVHLKLEMKEVTQEHKLQYREFLANQNLEKLIGKSKPKSKRKKKKGAAKIVEKPTLSSTGSTTKVPPEPHKPTESPGPKRLFDDETRDKISLLPRVSKRWATKSLSKLEAIQDIRKGEKVQSYKGLKKDDLLRERACHYLPGVEELIAHPEARQQYTFDIDKRTRGIVAKLIFPDKSFDGIVSLGLETIVAEETQHIVFHRYFKTVQTLDTLFSKSIQEEEENGENGEEWKPVGRFSPLLHKDGCLEFLFRGEEYKLVVFPVNHLAIPLF